MGVSAHLQISANNFATESFIVYMYYCKDKKKKKHKAKTYDSKKVISEVTSSRREKEKEIVNKKSGLGIYTG